MMNIIIRANKEVFKEECDMCEAILELFEDEVNIRTAKARNEGKLQGKLEGKLEATISSCKSLGASREKTLEMLIQNLDYTVEQAEDYLKLHW